MAGFDSKMVLAGAGVLAALAGFVAAAAAAAGPVTDQGQERRVLDLGFALDSVAQPAAFEAGSCFVIVASASATVADAAVAVAGAVAASAALVLDSLPVVAVAALQRLGLVISHGLARPAPAAAACSEGTVAAADSAAAAGRAVAAVPAAAGLTAAAAAASGSACADSP